MLSGSDSDDEFSFEPYARSESTVDFHQRKDLEKAKLSLIVAQDVRTVLMVINGCKMPQFNLLEWWRSNCTRYPNVACAARKWLSVSSLSTPSELVFSICRIADTSKWASILELTKTGSYELIFCWGSTSIPHYYSYVCRYIVGQLMTVRDSWTVVIFCRQLSDRQLGNRPDSWQL